MFARLNKENCIQNDKNEWKSNNFTETDTTKEMKCIKVRCLQHLRNRIV